MFEVLNPSGRLPCVRAMAAIPGLLALLAFTACAASSCPKLGDRWVKLSYTSGGAFPWGQDLTIFETILVLEEPAKRPRCASLQPGESAALVQALRDSEKALQAATVEAGGNADWEEVYIYHGSSAYRVLVKRQSPELGKVFKKIDQTFSEKFGRHYQIRLNPG